MHKTKLPKIDSLTIKGFKSIKNLDKLQLNNLNILIGANGSGKSNFISYFRMLNEMMPYDRKTLMGWANPRLQFYVAQQGGSDRLLFYGREQTSEIYFKIEFGVNAYECILSPTVNDKLFFADEAVFLEYKTVQKGNNYPPQRISLGTGHYESLLPKYYNSRDRIMISIIQGRESSSFIERIGGVVTWRVYHFHDISAAAKIHRKHLLINNDVLFSNGENLAAFLYAMKQNNYDNYQNIIKTIQLVLPYFHDFIFKPDGNNIQLYWMPKNSDYIMLSTQLSDGSLRFICLVTVLLQPNPPRTIIIDEPELGLHPYAINVLGALLHSVSDNIQIIISTQSVALLDEFDLEDIIIVENHNGESDFRRLNHQEYKNWLKEYSVGELWNKNVLGGRP